MLGYSGRAPITRDRSIYPIASSTKEVKVITLTVFYKTPDDVEKFDKHYFDTHMPLARELPGIEDTRVTRFLPGADGAAPEFHLMTQLFFADADVMKAAMSSDEGQALVADVVNLGTTPSFSLAGATE